MEAPRVAAAYGLTTWSLCSFAANAASSAVYSTSSSTRPARRSARSVGTKAAEQAAPKLLTVWYTTTTHAADPRTLRTLASSSSSPSNTL
ncbi:hypothetical protein DIPPA_23237 [Diplonema papillatum]|nr:hypothetical protein DIPPA_23237 [Diplonema papillatum]